MDFVVSPIAVALNNHSGGNAAMSPGQVLDAVVTRVIDAEHVQLSLGSSLVVAKTQVPLLPGMRVQLVVKTMSEGTRLVLLRPPEFSGASAPRAGFTATAGEAPRTGTPGATASTTPTASGVPPANPAQALAAAMRSAAIVQDGLAPLFADAAVAAKLAGIPLAVREAVLRLLSFRLPVDMSEEADQLRRAVARSGLFLEANLGSAAAAASAKGHAAGTAIPGDLKAALVGLRAALKQWPASEQPASMPLDRLVAQVSTPASGATLRPGSAPAAALYKALLQAASGARAETAGSGSHRSDGAASGAASSLSQRPPPPYAGALPCGQPAAHSSITGEASLEMIARTLLAETEAALARHTLLQAASLPDRSGLPLPQADGAALRWLFEIPFGTPQGVVIAQFEIAEESAGGNAAEPAAPVWRVRFAIDIEPLGAVHAQVAVMGERTAVTLWAEREASAARLRAEAPLLADALRAAALDPSDLIVREGSPRPSAPPVPAGQFLDRAS